jgi:hypothetical protein
MQTITVRITQNYGVRAVYPVCATAQTLAALAGTKTLKPETLKLIEQLGYGVTVEQPTL